MSDCLSEIERMMVADGELRTGHLESCAECRAGVETYRVEGVALTEFFQAPQRAPAFDWSTAAVAALVGVLAVVAVRTLASAVVPGFGSLSDLATIGGTSLFWNLAFYLASNGEMLMSLLSTICFLFLVVGAVIGVWRYVPRFRTIGLSVALAAAALFPVPAQADTVDETLLVGDETVRIDDTVIGDILATGQTVILTGESAGNVNVMADTLEIDGRVGGAVYCMCRQVTVRGTVEGNLYMFGETAIVAGPGVVERDVLTFGKTLRIDGRAARDVRHAGAVMDIAGEVGRHVRGEVGQLTVGSGAKIGGNVEVTVPKESAAAIDPGATIDGEVKVDVRPEENPVASGSFYIWTAAGIFGTLLAGLILLRLSPSLFDRERRAPAALARTAGTGFLVLVAMPIIGALACVTVVALPIGLILLVAYVVGLYLAGVLFAGHIGTLIMRRDKTTALPMLVGAAALAIAELIPFLGGLVAFAAILFGLGLLYRAIAPRLRARG